MRLLRLKLTTATVAVAATKKVNNFKSIIFIQQKNFKMVFAFTHFDPFQSRYCLSKKRRTKQNHRDERKRSAIHFKIRLPFVERKSDEKQMEMNSFVWRMFFSVLLLFLLLMGTFCRIQLAPL